MICSTRIHGAHELSKGLVEQRIITYPTIKLIHCLNIRSVYMSRMGTDYSSNIDLGPGVLVSCTLSGGVVIFAVRVTDTDE
jgi:hypothetical protein